ncbi:MAG: DedA family protein [Ignavibacteria bacterium]|nr:DedA family protein [Ignavibacteria bacterium]
MEQKIVEYLSSPTISPVLLLFVAFFFSYIENILPPTPSDVIVLFLGSLVSFGRVEFLPLLIVTTFGSTSGFLTMFIIGKTIGERVIDKNRFKFLKPEYIQKVRTWFGKYGYWVVAGNRFLSGTRAVVAFAAGVAELSTVKSTFFAGISAFVWNFLIIYAGVSLGANWESALYFLKIYWRVILAVIVLALLFYFGVKLFSKKASKVEL